MIAALLQQASSGLTMPSESDYPFTVFVWPHQALPLLTPARLLELSGHSSDLEVSLDTLTHLLRNVAEPHDWHDDAQQALISRFQMLKVALEEHLSDLAVYRVGAVQVQVYIVGRSGDDLAGLSTVLIET